MIFLISRNWLFLISRSPLFGDENQYCHMLHKDSLTFRDNEALEWISMEEEIVLKAIVLKVWRNLRKIKKCSPSNIHAASFFSTGRHFHFRPSMKYWYFRCEHLHKNSKFTKLFFFDKLSYFWISLENYQNGSKGKSHNWSRIIMVRKCGLC